MTSWASDKSGKSRAIRVVLLAAIICTSCATCGGCATTPAGSFRFTGAGLEEGARKWRDQAPPATRVTIDALVVDRTVLVHFIRGDLTGRASRGTIALLAADDRAKAYCFWHPVVEGIKPERDWDVIYDRKQAEREAKRLGLPHPLEALLQHEVMGHVLPVLRDPTLLRRIKRDLRLKRENERYAIQQENEYRKHVGLPLVSEDISWFVSE